MPELHTLKNNHLTVTASSFGAELQSVTGADGVEYLWNGDPAYWSGRSPHLFPFVGSLRGGRAACSKGEVRLPQHGLARKTPYQTETAAETSVTYRLCSTEESLKGYPYDFVFRVRHSLDGPALTTTYIVENTGKDPMPFTVGGHPAFRVPLVLGEAFEDYRIEFERPETIDCPQVELPTALIVDTARNRLVTDSRFLHLNHVLFRGEALVMDSLRSRSVRLISAKSGRGVQMDFAGMDFFALWTPVSKDAPFLCLEPWTGTGTQVTEDDVFEHKQGMRILEPGETCTVSFTMTML